jgi:hypothetical protein
VVPTTVDLQRWLPQLLAVKTNERACTFSHHCSMPRARVGNVAGKSGAATRSNLYVVSLGYSSLLSTKRSAERSDYL